MTRLRPASRLVLSLSLYVISWLFVALGHPAAVVDIAIAETLFGSLNAMFYSYAFPLLPWFSLYLASTALGQHVGKLYQKGDLDSMSRVLGTLAIAACVLAAGLAAVTKYVIAPHLGGGQFVTEVVFALRAVDQKYPPGPVFLLFHGGVGLGLLCLCLWVERQGRAAVLLGRAVALGQCSLFCYILQYYVYYTALHFMSPHLPFRWAWPVYFVASAALIVGATLQWHRRGFNKFITVGYDGRPAHAAAAMSLRGLWR